MADISQWSETAASNDVTSPAGANTGWTGSQVGPWARETMAAVRRFYGDPTWITTLNDFTPSGTAKSVVRVDDNTFTIAAAAMSDPSALFPVGRLIRVRSASDSTPCFVVSASYSSAGTPTLTVDVACAARSSDSTAVLPGTGTATLSDDGVDFFSAQDDSVTYQALGAPAFGGGGTTTVRDAKYPSATDLPDGILWSNTTTAMLEATKSGAWVAIAPNTDAFSDSGGKLTLTSATNSQVDLKSAADEDSSIVFQENGSEKASLFYDASADETVLESGDGTTGSRIYLKDAGTGLFYKQLRSGTLGVEQRLGGSFFARINEDKTVSTTGASTTTLEIAFSGLSTLFADGDLVRAVPSGVIQSVNTSLAYSTGVRFRLYLGVVGSGSEVTLAEIKEVGESGNELKFKWSGDLSSANGSAITWSQADHDRLTIEIQRGTASGAGKLVWYQNRIGNTTVKNTQAVAASVDATHYGEPGGVWFYPDPVTVTSS